MDDFSGKVEVRPGREGKWAPAKRNMNIIEGGAVRTSAGAIAVVLLPNKTKIWLKESSSLELEQRTTLASRIALVFGSIKLRVPHLMRKERFEVRTPAAVCAVRGTEFTVDTDEAGRMGINVLYGEVKLNFVVPPEKGAAELFIPQGRTMRLQEKGQPGKVGVMTAADERASLEDWDPWLKPEERQKDLQEKENDRGQLKQFADATGRTENAVKDFLNTVKESDLEAGRTMNDIHGNVVRVDQRLMRPDSATLQFYNIVKRPVYNYADSGEAAVARGGFAYNGAPSVQNRLDLMQMTMKFNQDLPQRIEEWAGFFNGNSVDPVYATFLMANRTYRDEIFFTGEGYKWDAARDTLVSNPWVVGIPTSQTSPDDRAVLLAGILTGVDAVAQFNALSRLEITDAKLYNFANTQGDLVIPGLSPTPLANAKWAIQVPRETAGGLPGGYNHYELTGDPVLSQYRADLYNIGNTKSSSGADYIWYARENYAINNSGAVRQADDFTRSDQDAFSLLKDMAGESMIYVKKAAAGQGLLTAGAAYSDIDNSATGDYFKNSGGNYTAGTNIDLVIIPDLALAAVQKMLPALTSLNE